MFTILSGSQLTCANDDGEQKGKDCSPAAALQRLVALERLMVLIEVRVSAGELSAAIQIYVQDFVPRVERFKAQIREHRARDRTEIKRVIFSKHEHQHATYVRMAN